MSRENAKYQELICGFVSQRPVARSFDVFFDLRLNERLIKNGAYYDVIVMDLSPLEMSE